ncbi:MAG: hypothetical protein AB7U63_08730 [Porticoccaceae bacterium]
MRMIVVGILSVLIAACQPGSIRRETQPDSQAGVPAAAPMDAESAGHTSINDWLMERQTLCSLAVDDQRRRLEMLAQSSSDSFEALQRVFLASCRPESTPGLLRDALNNLDIKPSWTAAQHALLVMMRDHARSYGILEERITSLSTELETTIEGIRDIETDMEKINLNGAQP